MAKIQILLYSEKGLVSSLIRFQTRSRYSHAAFCFNRTVIIESVPWVGVRERIVTERDWKADGYSLEMTVDQHNSLLAWCHERLGCRYDWPAVLRFISRRHSYRDNKFFCSEFCVEGLHSVGIMLLRAEPWMISPCLLSMSPLLQKDEPCR